MAGTDSVNEVLSNIFSGAAGFSANILIGFVVIVVVAGLLFYFLIYRRKYDILVKVTSERAEDNRIFFDKGAIIKDKKGNKYFRLLATRVELPVPPFKVLTSTNRGDLLELWRKSEDEFVFLTKANIDKTKVIRADGKLYPIASTEQKHIEGDIYWMTKRREDNKKLLDPESLLMKLLTWAPQILSSIFLLIILFIFMDKLPTLVNELVELTRELRQLKGVAT